MQTWSHPVEGQQRKRLVPLRTPLPITIEIHWVSASAGITWRPKFCNSTQKGTFLTYYNLKLLCPFLLVFSAGSCSAPLPAAAPASEQHRWVRAVVWPRPEEHENGGSGRWVTNLSSTFSRLTQQIERTDGIYKSTANALLVFSFLFSSNVRGLPQRRWIAVWGNASCYVF